MKRKSYAKVNIFLKIAGRRDSYHELVSRFVLIHSLYDEIEFIKQKCEEFTLVGNFACETKSNTIYKAYKILKEKSTRVEEYFKNHIIKVQKNIPEFAGLGGGSSNCATFIIMVNEVCTLNLTKNELAKIAIIIGADVPFFVYEYDSANVRGIGEIVEKFDEEILDIEVITPQIKCNTKEIFEVFRDKFYKEINKKEEKILVNLKSKQILRKLTIFEANDLYAPALSLNDELKKYDKKAWFFSGSGSSFFKVNYE